MLLTNEAYAPARSCERGWVQTPSARESVATSYDLADAAYEWSAGQYADATDSRAEGVWTQPLSQDLAGAYASFVNNMDLLDSNDSKNGSFNSAEYLHHGGLGYMAAMFHLFTHAMFKEINISKHLEGEDRK